MNTGISLFYPAVYIVLASHIQLPYKHKCMFHYINMYNILSYISILYYITGWWSMAQLAAQDYFTRLQASGLSPFAHPDLAAAFPSSMGMGGVSVPTSTSGSGRQSGGDTKSNSKNRKDKKQSSNNSSSNNNSSGNSKNSLIPPSSTSSSTASSYKVHSNSLLLYRLHGHLQKKEFG